MESRKLKIRLDRQGVDEISSAVRQWAGEAGFKHKDIVRACLILEEVLTIVCEQSDDWPEAEVRLSSRFGSGTIRICYGGAQWDPTGSAKDEMEEWSKDIFSRVGQLPAWRWRAGRNELTLHLTGSGKRSEIIMLGSLIAAIGIGLLGAVIPGTVRTALSDYVLVYLSEGFLNLLNTFIGLMVFFSVVSGICRIGNAETFSRIGKVMISRFVGVTFLLCAVNVFAAHFFFSFGNSTSEPSGSQFAEVQQMIFGIIPSDPVSPFLNGNTLQIVFLAMLTGVMLLLAGSAVDGIRRLMNQAEVLLMKIISAVCKLLPIYILSSLILQFWENGFSIFLRIWKPILVCAVIASAVVCGFLMLVCGKLRVRASVLFRKLLPGILIGVTTSSTSAAFPTMLETNEKRLGIPIELSRVGTPIGGLLFGGMYSLIYIVAGLYLAETYGTSPDVSWWLVFWIICALVSMATPPVAGGAISGLAIVMTQTHIPQEGLVLGAAIVMFIDFICVGARVPVLQMELILQARKLGVLDEKMLQKDIC